MVAEISVHAFHLDLQKWCECVQGRICQCCYQGDIKHERTCTELDALPGI